MKTQQFQVTPSAARLATSLRDVGYDFVSAIADIVDNSIAAGATEVDVRIHAQPNRVVVVDNGSGMTPNALNEALRFGSRRHYADEELGRYGLGLKTASLSQCRSLTVVTRDARMVPASTRQLSLDLIDKWDEWLVVDPGASETIGEAQRELAEHAGTIVIWESMDRAFPGRYADGAWAVRRAGSLRIKTAAHLALVFQRFIDGSAGRRVSLRVDGTPVDAWDPFARAESETHELAPQSFEINDGPSAGTVTLRRWILPARNSFASAEAFERLGGPLKWNRQQGIYIYRANRLVQWGGWAGIRAIDEHTKLARCSLDYATSLDSIFGINVAKMRVSVPPSLKRRLEKPLHEVCQLANERYRKATHGDRAQPVQRGNSSPIADESAALALLSAAVQTGHYKSLVEIAAVLSTQAPNIAKRLGLDRL